MKNRRRFALPRWQLGPTSPKTNMDTQNDGLEKVDSFKIWPCFVSIVKFLGYKSCQDFVVKEVFKSLAGICQRTVQQ